MTIHKTTTVMLGMLALAMISSACHAMDAETLYRERACVACHGVEGRSPVLEEYPKIAGQLEPYLLAQMKDFKRGARTNAHSAPMLNVMHLVSEDELATIAKWLAGLPE
jgi:cytochrome c